ncbi:MAG: hypothetical protein K9M11_00610 [Candidatus Pacebacteria bacterium]|nr:hypothetical protein [Candidatus Paceibacterota bacterium]
MTQILKGKTKATPKTIKIILDAISHGASQRDASALAGISEDTLSFWKRDSDFSEQMRQKEIEYKMEHIKIIKEASKKTWQAAAWWLERRYPSEYTNRVRVETPEPMRTGFEGLSDDELQERIDKMAKSNGWVKASNLGK